MARPTVEDVMSQRLVSVLEHTTFKEIVRLLVSNHVDLLPVVDVDRRVVGVVATSDLMARFGGRFRSRSHHKQGATAAELMTAPAITTTPDATVEDAARVAMHERLQTMPVVDRYGMLLGTVSLGDFATIFLRADEDLTRDVQHEIALHPEVRQETSASVVEGVVTLSGPAPDAASARRLVDAITRLPGVIGVRDDFNHQPERPPVPAWR